MFPCPSAKGEGSAGCAQAELLEDEKSRAGGCCSTSWWSALTQKAPFRHSPVSLWRCQNSQRPSRNSDNLSTPHPSLWSLWDQAAVAGRCPLTPCPCWSGRLSTLLKIQKSPQSSQRNFLPPCQQCPPLSSDVMLSLGCWVSRQPQQGSFCAF